MSLQERYKKKEVSGMPSAVVGQRWFKLVEAAAYMASHKHFVRDLILAGKIPHQKTGRGYVLDRVDMDRYLEQNKKAA
jgi:excisionase family DNA binding protein